MVGTGEALFLSAVRVDGAHNREYQDSDGWAMVNYEGLTWGAWRDATARAPRQLDLMHLTAWLRGEDPAEHHISIR